MLVYVKEACTLYKQQFLRLLLIGVTVILPIQVIYTFTINYIAGPFKLFGIPLWTSFFQSVFMLMSIFIMILPIISIVVQDTRQEKVKIGSIYGDFIKNAFFIYMISIPFAIVTTLGFLLFIIPGIFLLVLFMGIPFVKAIDDDPFKVVIKQAYLFGKQNFMLLSGLLITFAIVDFVLSYLFSFIAIVFTEQMAIVNWTLLLINMFLIPLYIITVTKIYLSWNGEADSIKETDYIQQLAKYN